MHNTTQNLTSMMTSDPCPSMFIDLGIYTEHENVSGAFA